MLTKLLGLLLVLLAVCIGPIAAQGNPLLSLAHFLQGFDPSGPPRLFEDHHSAIQYSDYDKDDSKEDSK